MLRAVDVRGGVCKRVAWTSTVNGVVVRGYVLRGRNLCTYMNVWARHASGYGSAVRITREDYDETCAHPRGDERKRLGGGGGTET